MKQLSLCKDGTLKKLILLLSIPLLALLFILHPLKKAIWNINTLSFLWLSSLSLLLIPLEGDNFISHHTYIDLLSSVIIGLTLLITALIFVASQKILLSKQEPKIFSLVAYLLTLILVEAYSTPNLFNFYIFFEASLIPTLVLILSWGLQPERLQAGTYLILYTVTASLPLLFSIFILQTKNFHLNIFLPFWATPAPAKFLIVWWLFTIIPFLVKTPTYLVHLWLPKAHVEAPVAGSIVLAGVLLKLGSYGLFRLSSHFPQATLLWRSPVIVLSLWGGCIARILCLRQTDIKALIAYSSVSHIGLVTAGVVSQTQWGWTGALLLITAHGLASSGLFALANTIYETAHRRNLIVLKGMINLFPAITVWWFILSARNLGAPPSINMLSEIALITATVSLSSLTMPVIGLVIILTTAYCLLLFRSTQYGPLRNYINPWNLDNQRHYSISALHAIPIFIFFIKGEFMSLWV